jgi:hypothetical protein
MILTIVRRTDRRSLFEKRSLKLIQVTFCARRLRENLSNFINIVTKVKDGKLGGAEGDRT